ncbi:MAG: hypothetical protein DMG57_30855 [Acidobacteria bacterium]|nr:MAG: hypothetical protein DMG57_30855 [Acidobacteriota bacterium]
MKSTLVRFARLAALASGILLAQNPAPPAEGQPPAQRRQWNRSQSHRGQGFDKMAQKLNLTDSQKAQARSILDSARTSAKPIAQQLRQEQTALHEAVKAGRPDADIDRLSSQVGNLEGQMTAIRSKAFAKVYALLTPEQRTQADQMHQQRRGMFKGGRGHGNETGSGS